MGLFRARYRDGVLVDNQFYYFDEYFQMLCVADLDSYYVRIVKRLKKETIEVKRIFYDKKKFYLIGSRTNQGIYVYNLEDESIKKYSLPDLESYKNEKWSPFFEKQYIYLLCRNSKSNFMVFDIVKREYIITSSITNMRDDLGSFQIYFPTFYNNIISFAMPEKNKILFYDIIQQKIKDYKLEMSIPYITLIDTNRIWVMTKTGELICRNSTDQTNIQLQIEEPTWIFLLNKYVCVSSAWEDKVFLVDKENFTVENINLPFNEKDKNRMKSGSNFANCFETEDYIYLVPRNASGIYRIFKKSLKAEFVNLKYNPVIIQSIDITDNELMERETILVDDFIEMTYVNYEKDKKAYENIGNKIWNHLSVG